MSKSKIYINGTSSISALGSNSSEVWENYKKGKPYFSDKAHGKDILKVSQLSKIQNAEIAELRNEKKLYNSLDKTTLLAVKTGRHLFQNLKSASHNIGVNIGSSRGATQTFEKAHQQYLEDGEVPIMTSPTTTLGNVASSVAQDLGLDGPAISHSITCSSASHALLNAIAYLKSGMLEHFIIGGTEAPLTDFTISQMQALKLYSKRKDEFACRSLDFSKTENTLVLGEAACLAYLSKEKFEHSVEVAGIGYATEQIEHSVSLSKDAKCIQDAMIMALNIAELNQVDAIVLHAPGTIKGDKSELKAIENTFGTLPSLTTNKYLIGHTFGASGAMSLEMACLMLLNNEFILNPFYNNNHIPKQINTIMVNAVGFGGNAVSIILKKPD